MSIDTQISTEDAPIASPSEEVASTEVDTDVVAESEQTASNEEPSEQASDSSPEKKGGIQKRFDELSRDIRETKEDRDYWRNLALDAQKNAQQPKPEPKNEAPDRALLDIDTEEEFQQYLKEVREKAYSDARNEVNAGIQQDSREQAQTKFREREAKFAETVEDYQKIVSRPDLPITDAMVDVLLESERGPQMLYYLGSTSGEAARMANMPEHQMYREMARLEVKLENMKAAEKKTSEAPEPPPSIKPTNAKHSKEPHEMSQKEFEAHRRKVIKRRRGY